MSFRDRRVLVTGASGGIGSRTALLFAERGADVAVHCHSRRDRAREVAGKITGMNRKAFTLQADLGNPTEAKEMVEEAAGLLGGLDILVNNAAMHPPPMFSLREPDWGHWRRMMETNVMGVIACSGAAAPHLSKTGGCIVNVVMDWDAGGMITPSPRRRGRPSRAASPGSWHP